MEPDACAKAHRARRAGRKAERKKQRKGAAAVTDDGAPAGDGGESETKKKGHAAGRTNNAKAFTFRSAVKAAKAMRKAADISERKKHIPVAQRAFTDPSVNVEAPPVVVAVVGPRCVGKSTLLRCIAKHYCKQPLTKISGPVTLVAGRKKRITLLECANDVNCMIDVAKVADLVLLMIDAYSGFEMDTFEFLKMLQTHGMTKVMGVLTHLDMIKSKEKIKDVKKSIKHRLWTEVYQGAKLFYLSGMQHDRYYPKEVQNLCRFISVMKFRPLTWRSTHPYVLCDRMEDVTDPKSVDADSKCDRSVCMYGYVRGTHFRHRSHVHIPGVGDAQISTMHRLDDPCPLPFSATADNNKKQKEADGSARKQKHSRRYLSEREMQIYAPMSGLGGLVYDKDAVYVDMPAVQGGRKKMGDLPSAFAMAGGAQLDKIHDGAEGLQLVGGGNAVVAGDNAYDNDDGDVSERGSESDAASESGSDYESMSDDGDHSQHMEVSAAVDTAGTVVSVDGSAAGVVDNGKKSLHDKAAALFMHAPASRINWNKLVYGATHDAAGPSTSQAESDEDGDGLGMGLLRLATSATSADEGVSCDCCAYVPAVDAHFAPPTDMKELAARVSGLFVRGASGAYAEAKRELEEGQSDAADSDDDGSDGAQSALSDDDDADAMEEGDCSGGAGDTTSAAGPANLRKRDVDANAAAEKRLAKKKKLKQLFDAEYDESSRYYNDLKAELAEQAKLNASVFDHLDAESRVQLEGHKPGTYVRMQFDSLPCELVEHFDARYPLIVGALMPAEQNMAFALARIQRHRWYPRILKTRDPLIMSMGWRRFQTIVYYCMQEHNMRNRLIKYTPEYLHCNAAFWSPATPQNTPILAVQTVCDNESSHFRIAATGVVLALDRTVAVEKKLKLTGYPYKVYKKSAFIKGMFNSALEVAKFEGATLRTVSGLRGQIKRALHTPPGAFRAMFEDKILLRDLVFVRTWYTVQMEKYYAPVTNVLLADAKLWQGMKTVGQLRYERGLSAPQKTDSAPKEIQRRPFIPDALVIPNNLQKQLPYAFKPKNERRADKLDKDYDGDMKKHTTVVLEPHESETVHFMSMLRTNYGRQVDKEKAESHRRYEQYGKELAEAEAKRAKRDRKQKSAVCKKLTERERHATKMALKRVRKGKR